LCSWAGNIENPAGKFNWILVGAAGDGLGIADFASLPLESAVVSNQ